ncbi:unnamed protein product [Heterosigma akashiwo]
MAHPEVRSPLPRRASLPAERGTLIVAAAAHRQKDMYFFLLQSEYGDVYKVTLETAPDNLDEVRDVKVAVFDTLPVASALCITRTGLLFAASEFGNHHLFHTLQVGKVGGPRSMFSIIRSLDPELGDDALSAAAVAPLFAVRARPRNLALFDEVESLAPALQMAVADYCQEGTPQARIPPPPHTHTSSLLPGAAFDPLPPSPAQPCGPPPPRRPAALRPPGDGGRYIVVSFTNATLVLSIGETVEEVADSGFLAAVPTLAVALLDDNSTLQAGDDCAIHEKGIRHLRADARPAEWKTPGKKTLERAAANGAQLAVALAGGEVIYFELDASGALAEVATRELGVEVACLDVGEPPEGRVKSAYLVVGGYDDTVRVLSLDPAQGPLLEQKAALTLPARAESLCLAQMAAADAGGAEAHQTMTLHAGLANGTAQRATLDLISGTLSDPRTRFLGSRPVRLFRTKWAGRGAGGAQSMFSSRTWLSGRAAQRRAAPVLAPLSYPQLDYAATFASEQARPRPPPRPPPPGRLAVQASGVAGGRRKILTLARLADLFQPDGRAPAVYAQRMCPVPNTDRLLIVECDQNEFNAAEREKIEAEVRNRPDVPQASSPHPTPPPPRAEISNNEQAQAWRPECWINVKGRRRQVVEMEEEEEDEEGAAAAAPAVRGPAPPTEGKWASCVRVLDPAAGETRELLEMGDNEAAFSCATCVFHGRGGEAFVVVGTARHLRLHPAPAAGGCFLHVYRLIEDRLVPLHRTPVEEVPLALAEFQGRLLAGVGKSLRVYDLGKKKLLRKCENKTFPTMITDIKVQGDRIYVSDMMESFHLVKYKRGDNSLAVFADDQVPRALSASCLLDYDTVAGATKFGDVFTLRLPVEVSDDVDNPTGNKLLWDNGVDGAPNKLENLTNFHIGEVITSITKAALVPGGAEAILYCTIQGTIGALLRSPPGGRGLLQPPGDVPAPGAGEPRRPGPHPVPLLLCAGEGDGGRRPLRALRPAAGRQAARGGREPGSNAWGGAEKTGGYAQPLAIVQGWWEWGGAAATPGSHGG